MTLHERVQLLLLGFLVVLALTGVVGALAVGQRDALVAEAASYNVARDYANDLLTQYVDQETAVRAYVISRDTSLLEQYEDGEQAADATLARLRAQVAAEPSLVEAVDRVEVAADRWRTDSAEEEIALTSQGEHQAAADLVATGEGQELFDALRGEIMAVRDRVRTEQDEADARLGVARRQLNLAIFITVAIAALLLFVITRALEHWSTRPLREISEALRMVTDGDLDRRIPAVGPRDIAELGGDAEFMRRRIVTELDSARRAEQALRSQGAIVSVLREELGPSQQALPASLSMAAGFEPVKGVLAGDWYDVLSLDDGTVAVCLIDVSGHGQSTGVFALQAKNLMLAGARQLLDPGAVLSWMSRALGDTGDNFLTGFIARIDPETGECSWASAGHLPTLLTRDGTITELGPTGPLLGPLPGEWATETVHLAEGSVLVAYTDGVTEARGPSNEEFGDERLRAVVAARAGEHPTSVISTCLDAVHDFAKGEANDDLTIVAVRWLPRS